MNYLKKPDDILARALVKPEPIEAPEPIVSSKAKPDKRDATFGGSNPSLKHRDEIKAPRTKKRPKAPPPKLGDLLGWRRKRKARAVA